MTQELIYTSAPKGLQLGSRGFCTVASTAGMSKPLADRLEALSGYKHLFPPGSDSAHFNPVIYSFVTFKLGGKNYYVLSRIADAGLDYTQRSNKLAHHVVLEASELPPEGPASLMQQPGFFVERWEGEPRTIEARRLAPSPDHGPRRCDAWESVTGDAGWGGVLAISIRNAEKPDATVILKSSVNGLELVSESQSLLLPFERWAATFSTCFSKLPPGIDCKWKILLDTAQEAIVARRAHGRLLIDLSGELSSLPSSADVIAARLGRIIETGTSNDAAVIASHQLNLSQHSEVAVTAPPIKGMDRPPISVAPPRLPVTISDAGHSTAWSRNSTLAIASMAFVVVIALAVMSALVWKNADILRTTKATVISPALKDVTTEDLSQQKQSTGQNANPKGNEGKRELARKSPSLPTKDETADEAEPIKAPLEGELASVGEPKPSVPKCNFSDIVDSALVPRVRGSVWMAKWDAPVPLGVLQSAPALLTVKPTGVGSHVFNVTRSESGWAISDAGGREIAELSLAATQSGHQISFKWKEAAQSVPKESDALQWAGLQFFCEESDASHVAFLSPKPLLDNESNAPPTSPLRFRKGLANIKREVDIPANQLVLYRCVVDVDDSLGSASEQRLNSHCDFPIDLDLSVNVRVSVDEASANTKDSGATAVASVNVYVADVNGKELSLDDSISVDTARRPEVLIEAIEHLSKDKDGVADGQLISKGLELHFPKVSKKLTYMEALQALSMRQLERFYDIARVNPVVKPPYEPLLALDKRIAGLKRLKDTLSDRLSISLLVARQIALSTSDVKESEVFRAGRLGVE